MAHIKTIKDEFNQEELCLLGRSWLESADVSEEHIASIIRVDQWTKQETSIKQAARKGELQPVITAYFILGSCLGYTVLWLILMT
jgi:hypothetical protein